jgi:protein gp37
MSKTTIAWTERTWNPVTGCTKVSPGCDNCYAERFAERWRGIKGHAFERGFDLVLHHDRLKSPLRVRKPSMFFVNSMSDLFHKDVPDEFIGSVFATMAEAVFCPYRHTFQILTKRPERMRRLLPLVWETAEPRGGAALEVVMRGVWLGVSIESNDYAWRAGMLRETPARVRFLSIEPLLAPVDHVNLDRIDWVIVGGESGPGARPMNLDWARDVRDRCVAAGIPFFFKQLGGVRDKRANEKAVLDGETWTQMPAVAE